MKDAGVVDNKLGRDITREGFCRSSSDAVRHELSGGVPKAARNGKPSSGFAIKPICGRE